MELTNRVISLSKERGLRQAHRAEVASIHLGNRSDFLGEVIGHIVKEAASNREFNSAHAVVSSRHRANLNFVVTFPPDRVWG